MDTEQRKQIKKYLDLLFLRKKMIFIFLLIAVGVGLYSYVKTPKVYLSTSMLMYQRQKINPAKMSPDEERKIGEMVSTVSQQVTSRTSLESIISQYNLYEGQRVEFTIEQGEKGPQAADVVALDEPPTEGAQVEEAAPPERGYEYPLS